MENFFTFDGALEDRRRNKYAIVVFLPAGLNEMAAPLREQFDPFYNLVASHITLVFPFDTNRPLEELAGIIKSEVDKLQSFLIQLDTVGDFYPKAPIIYWKVKENTQLCELYYRLYSALGMPIPFKQLTPHVTVAREISSHRVIMVKEKIASYLPQEKFYAGSIDLITPLVNERWVSVRTFPFKGSVSSPPSI